VAALAQYGLQRSPAALKAAAVDLMSRGPGWRSRAAEGLRHVAASFPDIAQQLGEILKASAPARGRKNPAAASSKAPARR
jgi:hypothetical protein